MAYERIVKRFYDELESGRIMGRKCTRCGAVEYPPVIACNTCNCTEMEWVEMDGRGMLTEIVMPSPLTGGIGKEAMVPYAYGAITLEEGTGINGVVRGISKENVDELRASLPLPVKMAIVQRDGYKTVFFDLVTSGDAEE